MDQTPLQQAIEHIPALQNPTTPAMKRLRARLEAKPLVIPRRFTRKRHESPGQAQVRQRNSELHAMKRTANRTQVPHKLTEPHPLVAQAAGVFAKLKPNQEGLLIPKVIGCLDLMVSPPVLERALLILDTLIKQMEATGWRVEVAKRGQRQTTVNTGTAILPFVLVEEVEVIKHPRPKLKDNPYKHGTMAWLDYDLDLPQAPPPTIQLTGRLRFRYSAGSNRIRSTWTDCERFVLEECIDTIIDGARRVEVRLKEMVVEEAERLRKREEMERQWEEERRQRLIADQHRQLVQSRIEVLEQHIGRMQKADLMREYARRIEEQVTNREIANATEWIRWVRSYADTIDPTLESSTPSAPTDSTAILLSHNTTTRHQCGCPRTPIPV
ncbi:MAG: hypothetical protein IT445_21180 [Phycisphaeraceae bacterium]|nr:hypothetical protein [Phycisphaeraceae bacterium]